MRANWTDKVVEEKMNNGEIGWTKERKKKKKKANANANTIKS